MVVVVVVNWVETPEKPLSPDDLMVAMVSVVVKGEGGGGLHGDEETR